MKTKELFRKLKNLKSILVFPFVAAFIIAFTSCGESVKTTEAEIVTEIAPSPPPLPQVITNGISSPVAVLSHEEAAPTEVFVMVEEMPSFPGGDTEMMNFIYKNIKYPENAIINSIQGRVIIMFCVTYIGEVNQVKVLKGVDPELDNEAMRVVGMLPQWKPGQQDGKPVNVWYSLPINFALKQ